MRVDAYQVFNVSIQLCEFFNVDLSERGYYQVRLRPRKTSDMWSVDISHDPEVDRDFIGPRKPNNILWAHVFQGAAVSKTVEVTFVNEHFKLEDWFHISVQFNSTLNLCETRKLEIDVELFLSRHMDRYHPPQIESFLKLTKRTIEIPLDPTRLTAAARSLYFDTSFFSAVTMCAFSSLVMVSTRQKRIVASVEQYFQSSGTKGTKLRRVYNSSAHALLFATRSIQQFIVRNSVLLNASVSVVSAVLDVQEEMKSALLRFDSSPQPTRCLETDVSEWSTKITLIYQQMHILFRRSNELRQQLLLLFDKQRGAVFREAFWLKERPIDEITIRSPHALFESYKSIVKVDYLKKLPRSTIFCEETDCPGEFCPIIFEDKYSREPEFQVQNANKESSAIPSSASLPVIKSGEKHKSFRDKLRKEAAKLIHPRRKSLDCQQSLSRKVTGTSSSRNRTKTMQETTTDGAKSSLLATLNREFQPENGEESPKCHSEPTVSPSPSSEYGRCSAAGEPAPLVSKESVTSDEVANALRASVSADDVLTRTPDRATSSSSSRKSPERELRVVDENPKETMANFELARERDATSRLLREEAFYDGTLYSEMSRKSDNTWPYSPVSSDLVIGDPVMSNSIHKNHLVVFVHGLEGSKDDLAPFKCGLEQSVAAHYQSLQKEHDEPVTPWKFEFLMSNSNRNDTWLDIKTMAHNLLAEIREYIEEARNDIHRVSFMAHSLGGVIVRTAVGMTDELEMSWLTERCHTLLTINSPHLGLAYVQKHIHWGVQIVKWWKKSRSMEQLTFRDSLDFPGSFVYKAALNDACAQFKHVILLGTPHDQLVPYMSSLLIPSKVSAEDQSKLGEAYREMMSALLNSMRMSPKTETVVRYTTFHQIASTNSQKIAGRAAHVVALEDAVFIEKLFNVSAYKYFI